MSLRVRSRWSTDRAREARRRIQMSRKCKADHPRTPRMALAATTGRGRRRVVNHPLASPHTEARPLPRHCDTLVLSRKEGARLRTRSVQPEITCPSHRAEVVAPQRHRHLRSCRVRSDTDQASQCGGADKRSPTAAAARSGTSALPPSKGLDPRLEKSPPGQRASKIRAKIPSDLI